MATVRLAVGLIWAAGLAVAQDADLTIFVDGALLDHGGVVEVTAVARPDAPTSPQTITLEDRYVRVELPYREGDSYKYRFRPVPEAMAREGMDRFVTEVLSYGGRSVEGPEGPIEADWRSVRVMPFDEYGALDSATRTAAAWGETQAFADPPPANRWGARTLRWVFDDFGDRRKVGLICADNGAIPVCTPDPDDALLIEALWWRAIAEDRLERLRHEALNDCYDGGGIFGRPKRCTGEPDRGWPSYRPDD